MKRKRKCNVCGARFELLKENRYTMIEPVEGGALGGLTKTAKTYEAFDCPICGCQNVVNVRNPSVEMEKPIHIFDEEEEGDDSK